MEASRNLISVTKDHLPAIHKMTSSLPLFPPFPSSLSPSLPLPPQEQLHSREVKEWRRREAQRQQLMRQKLEHYTSLEKQLQEGLDKLQTQQKVLQERENKVRTHVPPPLPLRLCSLVSCYGVSCYGVAMHRSVKEIVIVFSAPCMLTNRPKALGLCISLKACLINSYHYLEQFV